MADKYVDSYAGNDDFPGTESKPYKTIQKAADLMNEGDVCHIKKGIYRESIVLNKNYLTFKNYGNDYVLITGLDVIKGWKMYQGKILQAVSKKKKNTPKNTYCYR